jgi:hypothetical protein
MRVLPGISMQREFSLLDGKTREHPIQPLHQEPALVQIGNQRMMARVEVAPQPTTSEVEENKRKFVRGLAARQNHECGETLMGEFCGHLL